MGRPPMSFSRLMPILESISGGKTWIETSRDLNVAESTIRRMLTIHGRVRNRPTKQRVGALTLEDRVKIGYGIREGKSDASIGAEIGKHRSTVWREIKAGGGRDNYQPVAAHDDAQLRARRPRPCWIETRPEVWELVCVLLRTKKWSPEQISQRLRKDHPGEPRWWVSPETIYQAIFVQAKPELRKELGKCLRSGRVNRRPHSRTARSKTRIKDMINISERPAEAQDRAIPGHWEGDLIIGKHGRSAVATLVERSTRFAMMAKLDNKTAAHVADAIAAKATNLPRDLKRSLTWDQGIEMADHTRFSVETDIPVYFCDPHSPWQRGTNENWNGLVRQFLPKGTDLSVHTQTELDEIAALLNERPRKTLNWNTPAEQFNQLVAATG